MMQTFFMMMLFFCVAVGTVPVAFGDYYQYTDTKGAAHISNKLDSVPQKYRSRVKVTSDEALSKQDLGARKQPPQSAPAQEESSAAKEEVAPSPAHAPEGKFATFSARYAWFQPLVYLVAIMVAFLVVIKLTALVPSGLLSKLIYLSFFMGVFVFLYKAYVENVVESTTAVKEKAITMMKKSNVRETPVPGEANR